jgi:hypothetical protein
MTLEPAIRASVVIPAYNAEETVGEAIASVLSSQDAGTLEVVVVDDGSTDQTRKAVGAFSRRDERVRLISHDKNMGVSEALNTGVRAAEGEYVVHLDADDQLSADFFDALSIVVEPEIDVVVFGHAIVRPDGSSRNVAAGASGIYTAQRATILAMLDRISGLAGGTVIRRSLMLEVPFPRGLRRYEDLVTNIALFSRARRVAVVNRPVYRYHMSGGSATWGKLATPSEVSTALDFLDANLSPTILNREVQMARDVLRVLCLLVSAQSVMHRRHLSDEAVAHVRRCAKAISFREVKVALFRRPDYALAAFLLKASPQGYRWLYRSYASRQYGADQF